MHSHDYFNSAEEREQEVKYMDSCGIEKTIIFGGTGKMYDVTMQKYRNFENRFEIWYGFDYTGYDHPVMDQTLTGN